MYCIAILASYTTSTASKAKEFYYKRENNDTELAKYTYSHDTLWSSCNKKSDLTAFFFFICLPSPNFDKKNFQDFYDLSPSRLFVHI